jgi:hypothetical protein
MVKLVKALNNVIAGHNQQESTIAMNFGGRNGCHHDRRSSVSTARLENQSSLVTLVRESLLTNCGVTLARDDDWRLEAGPIIHSAKRLFE